MVSHENINIITKLEDFLKELTVYHDLQRRRMKGERLNEDELRLVTGLRSTLLRKLGEFKSVITDEDRKENMRVFWIGGKESSYDIWNIGLKFDFDWLASEALDYCKDATDMAIGKLTDGINKGIRDKQGKVIEKPPELSKKPAEVIGELPIQLFDKMQFHPKVVEASKDCFIAGNYREAILNAFICLIDCVKERTGLDLDGDDLMNQVFSINYDKERRRITKYPIIRINELKNKSDRDEQQGFMFLCKGAAVGIRNPKAHKLIPQSNPLYTLEYLAFASLLVRRVEEGEIEKPNNKEINLDHQTI